MAAEAAGAQGQPGGCDVRRKRPAGLRRRTQEPEGRWRHRARHHTIAAIRKGNARAAGRAAAVQRHASARLLVRGDLERQPPLHGALEAGARGNLQIRGAVVLRADRFPADLQHWILFYVEVGETRKSVLRQHQLIAIAKIVARCLDTARKRGLVRHTRGSGKTFTLLTAARLILEEKARFHNAIVILVVDRIELEGQLKGWVEKLLGEMQQQDTPVWRANSQAEVQDLLKT